MNSPTYSSTPSSRLPVDALCIALAAVVGAAVNVPLFDLLARPGAVGAGLGILCGTVSASLVAWPKLDPVRPFATGLLIVILPTVAFFASIPVGAGWLLCGVVQSIIVSAWTGTLRPRPPTERPQHRSFQLTVGTNAAASDPLVTVAVLSALTYALLPAWGSLVVAGVQAVTISLWSLVCLDRESKESSEWLMPWARSMAPVALGVGAAAAVASLIFGRFKGVGLGLGGVSVNLPFPGLGGGTERTAQTEPAQVTPGVLIALAVLVAGVVLGRLAFPWLQRGFQSLQASWRDRLAAQQARRQAQRVEALAATMADPLLPPPPDSSFEDLYQSWNNAAWLAGVMIAHRDGPLSSGRKVEAARILASGQGRSAGVVFSRCLYGHALPDDKERVAQLVYDLLAKAQDGMHEETRRRKSDELKLIRARERIEGPAQVNESKD